MIGRVLTEMGHAAAAVRWLRRSIAENANDESVHYDRADAWEVLASACESAGQPRRAERARVRALALRPESPATANNLAGQLIDRGAWSDAEAMLRRLLEAAPGLSMPWATLGVLRYQQDDFTRARDAFAVALDINPTCGPALVHLAFTHRMLGQHREAERAARAAENVTLTGAPAVPVAGVRRPRPRAIRPLGPRGVISIVQGLHGGAGRVAVDAVRALAGRRQLVLCANRGDYAGQGLGAELHHAGVEVRTIADAGDILRAIGQAQPSCVIDHSFRAFFRNGPIRVADERWIGLGHGAHPMPHGYDDYIANSEFTARLQAHIAPERLHRIFNAVDLRRFRPHRRRAGPVTIAVLSRLDTGKLPRQLLAYLPPLASLGARLLIAGRGRRRYEIEPELRERGLSHLVSFVGVIPHTATPAFLARADVGLHLTETEQETGSLAVIEMMASGLPIVSQPRGCLTEMVTSGANGYLATDPAEIADRLAALIRSPRLRARMGAASRRVAEQRYGMARYRAQMRALLQQRRRGSPPARAPGPPAPELVSVEGFRPGQAYLICATPRSGGNLLCEALTNTGVAGFPDEGFFPAGDRVLDEADHANLWRVLAARLEARTTPNGVFGTKLFLTDLERLLTRLRSTSGRENPAAFDLLVPLFPRLRLVRLIRRDRLRQAISRLRADLEGRWKGVGPDPMPVRIRLTAASIRRTLATVDAEEAQWDGFLARWPEPPVVVFYEDLAADYEKTARSVVAALGVDVPDPIVFGERRMVAQADALTDRWVAHMRRPATRTGRVRQRR
jgi:LPS sulfotransferase NodH/glycosyltransferase involved in cell wall biosynthesis